MSLPYEQLRRIREAEQARIEAAFAEALAALTAAHTAHVRCQQDLVAIEQQTAVGHATIDQRVHGARAAEHGRMRLQMAALAVHDAERAVDQERAALVAARTRVEAIAKLQDAARERARETLTSADERELGEIVAAQQRRQ